MSYHRLLAVLLTVGFVQSGLPSQAQVVEPANTITTQGQGQVETKPDSVRLNVGVETSSSELDAAREENNRRMQRIIEALKETGIPNLVLETSYINVHPVYGKREENRLPEVVGYRADSSLSVQVEDTDPAQLGEYGSRLIDTAFEAGANTVNGPSFYLDEDSMTEVRLRALEEAVNDARVNAIAMARAAGVEITGVYSIEGTPQYYQPRPVPMMTRAEAFQSDVAATPVETGETTVSSLVTVRFRF